MIEPQSYIDKNDSSIDWEYAFKLKNLAIVAGSGALLFALYKTGLFKSRVEIIKKLKPASQSTANFTKVAIGLSSVIAGTLLIIHSKSIPQIELLSASRDKTVTFKFQGITWTKGIERFYDDLKNDLDKPWRVRPHAEKNDRNEDVLVLQLLKENGDDYDLIKTLKITFPNG
jgi:hypothetical protein